MRSAFLRITVLVYVYLIMILSIFNATALAGYFEKEYQAQLTHAAMSIGFAALIWTFGLPQTIFSLQSDRIDREIEHRRQNSKAS